jgi:ABC-type multidrug transport system fused ATPase/permease subunit
MVTYIYASQRLFSNVTGFVSNFNEFVNKWPSVEKLHSEIHDKVRPENDYGSKVFINTNSGLILTNICFSIDEALIINDLNCSFDNGEVTAIVGESGSGKSTITDLIMRIHSADSGIITFDAYNINEYFLSSWRRNIGYVGQESFLFPGSIIDNITFGLTSKIKQSQIVTAAKKANAHEFIIEKENGYETLVGERGTKLSVGEKQRISIARALVRQPKILIFDEPTSALDYQNEKLIIDTMSNIKEDLILIIIAHKVSVLEKADKIVVIKKGLKVQEGTYNDLLKSDGEYHRLYKESILP